MIRQAIKLIWNQRRKHLGLSFEIFFSFLVLFAVFSFGFNNLDKYLQPLGFEYEDIWTFQFNRATQNDSLALAIDEIVSQQINNYPEVEAMSFCNYNVPFSGSVNTTLVGHGNTAYDTQIHWVDDNYFSTMQLDLIAGRFFGAEDRAMAKIPIVITEDLANLLFPAGDALGKTLEKIEDVDEPQQIVGITRNYRYKGGVMGVPHAVFFQKQPQQILPNILLKVKAGTGAAFEAQLMRKLQQIVPESNVEVKYMTDMRDEYLLLSVVPVLIFSIIGGFLIFNVALGLFGVLYQNINQRKQEIGVRRAIGSAKSEVTKQFVLEIMVLASMSLILGLFFAIQFPLLEVFELKPEIYLLAIGFAIISIYLLVIICALIPSRQAAQLHPALALREE
ncbi:MAG: ABC transporter permease [Bacteroidota bacterium]